MPQQVWLEEKVRGGTSSEQDPVPGSYKRPDYIEGRLELPLGVLKTKMEACSGVKNDEGKAFIQALLGVVVAVGGEDWEDSG